MRESVGIPFGHYQLVKRLARGGMAEVFLARQQGLEGFHRLVAIKRILPHLVDHGDFTRMFLDEARVAAQLSHPNVVHIYEFGKVEEHYFIAMEWVDGVHAGQLIKRAETERLPDVLVARIGADACAGLNYAHMMNASDGTPLQIVHRDVSPPNLIVSHDGIVKLVDFGIAKAVSCVEETRPGVVKGKFAYMSPEQTVGHKLDGRSDVFSLAICMWELLAGEVLIPREDPVEGMRMIRDGRLGSIRDRRPDIPEALAAAIEHGLEIDREHRATAMELGLELESFIKASTDGLGSTLELAQWVRARFTRESPTGPQLALEPAGTRPSTQATRHGLPSSTPIPNEAHGDTSMPTPTGGKRLPIGGADSVIVDPIDDADTSAIRQDDTIPFTPFDAAELRRDTPLDGPDERQLGDSQISGDRGPGDSLDGSGDRGLGDSVDGVTWDRDATVANTVSSPHTAIIDSLPARFEGYGPRAGAEEPTLSVLARPPGRRAAVVTATALATLAVAGGIYLLQSQASDAATAEPSPPTTPTALAATVTAPDAGAPHPAVVADAAPAPSPTTALEIVTRPPGATVKLKPGSNQATTPASFDGLPPGTYLVELSLDGYRPLSRQVDLQVGERRTLDLGLDVDPRAVKNPHDKIRREPDPPGKLLIRTRPYSVVYVGGKKLGITPLANVKLKPGEYTLTFRNPSHKEQSRRVQVRSGETVKLDFALD